MTDLGVELWDASRKVELEAFISNHEEATVFHRPEWHAVITASYGHPCHYWIARGEGRMVGGFPVVEVSRRPLGRKMVAMAYQMHSGLPVAESEEVARRLVRAALDHARQRSADYLEIRHLAPVHWLLDLGFVALDSHLCTTISPLKDLSLSRMRRGHRKDVKHARNRGVTITRAATLDELRLFRRIYLQEGRRQGSPQAGWRFFENQWRLAAPFTKLLLAWHKGRLVGGTLTLGDDRMFFGRCSAYSPEDARTLRVGKALYWRELQDAAERGCHSFSIGLSWTGDAGLIRAKEGWNGITYPVHVYVHPLRKTPRAPGRYFEGFGLAKAVWRRLPLWLTDRIGHQVTGWIC